jgi:hypothetical protein
MIWRRIKSNILRSRTTTFQTILLIVYSIPYYLEERKHMHHALMVFPITRSTNVRTVIEKIKNLNVTIAIVVLVLLKKIDLFLIAP